MNGFATTAYQTDCVLENCRWTSELLSTPDAALEARRKHLSDHAHAQLVEYIAKQQANVVRFERADTDPFPAS